MLHSVESNGTFSPAALQEGAMDLTVKCFLRRWLGRTAERLLRGLSVPVGLAFEPLKTSPSAAAQSAHQTGVYPATRRLTGR